MSLRLASLLTVCLFPGHLKPQVAEGSSLPIWNPGTQWVIKSVYRKLPGPRPRRPEDAQPTGWSEPVYWVFTVKRVKQLPGGRSFLIQIRDQGGNKGAMASIVLDHYPKTATAPETLALSGAKFYEMAGGELKSHISTFSKQGDEAVPVICDDSLVPCDFPVLPLIEEGSGTQQVKRVKLYAISDELDGLKYARDIEQIDFLNRSLESFVDKGLSAYLKTRHFPTLNLKLVELTRKFDGVKVKQVWTSSLPWFLYSEHPSRKSWLWEVKEAPATPAPSASPSASPAPAPDDE